MDDRASDEMTQKFGVTQVRVEALRQRETERFERARPKSAQLTARAHPRMARGVPMAWMSSLYEHQPVWVESGAGKWILDVDGHRYLDFNLADSSVFTGHARPEITEAVAARLALGAQFLQPTEDALVVAGELARRFALPSWQFTASATNAVSEALRVARGATGRNLVVLFDGHYHGHADETQAIRAVDGAAVPQWAGILPGHVSGITFAVFNDIESVDLLLRTGRVAAVLTEPAMTNHQGVILPSPNFHSDLRRATREHGTLLLLDETHTQMAGPGGLTGRWNLDPDMVILGKSIGGGVPVGAYGMRSELATFMETDGWGATGGTLFANALQMAACRAVLVEVLLDDVYDNAASLGARLADGIDVVSIEAGLPWRAHRLFNRSGYCFSGTQPTNAAEARTQLHPSLWALLRVYGGNRGVWEAIEGSGPAAGIDHTEADVDHYLHTLRSLVHELVS